MNNQKNMPDQKILDYINQQLKNGVSEENVKKALAGVGWEKTFIDEAFASVWQPNISIPVPDEKASVPAEPAAVEVQPVRQPAQQMPDQPQPVQQQATRQPAQVQPVPKEPDKNTLQEPEAILPFKVQPVPKETAADIFPATGQSQAVPDIQTPGEKNDISAQNIPEQSVKPQQADSAKPEIDTVFSNEVPKVSELDKAFDQTFGIRQGTGGAVPAAPKTAADPFIEANKQTFAANKENAGQIADPLAGLPDMGIGSGKAEALASGNKPVSDFADRSSAAADKTVKKPDEKELDELLDAAGGKPKKNSFFVFLAFGLIGIVLLGGAAYAYFFYLEPSSASIYRKMADAVVPVRTAEFSGKAAISIPSAPELGGIDALDIGLDFTGVFDAANNKDPVISVNISETDNVMSGSNSVKFETVSAGNAVYLKASDFSEASIAELTAYEGQWLKIDGSKILPEFESVFPVYSSVKLSAGIGDIDMAQLIKILISVNKPAVFKLKDKLGKDQINGVDCLHYAIAIDKNKLKTEVTAALTGADASEIGNYGQIIDKAEISGEIWIGEKDYSIYKTAYLMAYDGIGDAPAKTILNITVAGYNSGVSIAVPNQYRMGTEIFYDVMAKKDALAKESLALQNDSTRKNDMKLLFEAQKSWYLANKRFYTCSNAAGDCGGKPLNFPVSIGNYLSVTPGDPQPSGEVCGQDFVYCGIDNSKNAKNFCYYAKMSDGTFFTASPYGNFIRSAVPVNFKECQQGTLVE